MLFNIVFLDRETIRANIHRPSFSHHWSEYPYTAPNEVVSRLHDATIAITNKVVLNRAAIEQLPKLAFIAVAATGVNNVDLAACHERGIIVSNVREYATHAVPEHVLALLLALRRNLFALRDDVRSGRWGKSKSFCLLDHPIVDLFGSTIGIVGYGSIGRATASLAKAIGMDVLIAEHKGEKLRDGRVDFFEALRSDVVSLHCPLNEKTRNLIGPSELASMKQNAILINTARGGLIDEEALVRALKDGTIAGAAVDTVREEPPINGTPLVEADLPNLIVTPHVAWASDQAMQALWDQTIENIEAFASGEPRRVATPS